MLTVKSRISMKFLDLKYFLTLNILKTPKWAMATLVNIRAFLFLNAANKVLNLLIIIKLADDIQNLFFDKYRVLRILDLD
jgi:hypothetical protein